MNIRKAATTDLSRIAEIYIFNNRINYFPIFKDPSFSFGELQVVSLIDHYLKKEEILNQLYVFDDGLIKGFLQIQGTEICKLYVEPCFQSEGIGHELITYAIREFGADHLWALEKNTRAIAFYQRHGFCLTGEKEFEEGTTEYIVKLRR
ncbi:MAG: GNAT family N-acetyltransferase [Roseburia sp.]|uniref:GNAT family N-acetyltransferase n=1 Tax=Roseburia sp. 831b TaxID=1261635 RepID=UPI000951C390|nr:GNAT family N-acetyltransferase [Roseburia sp. 831b]MDD6215471.1 GNAT family N-acetyltransferase [Roseburia sp.]WVK72684.1 GNAT family N-acetyltransferase [Roseburia sp. 831b]